MSGYHKRNWEPFPMHAVKRVDRPTTEICEDQIQKTPESAHGFNRALNGDFGPFLQQERKRFATKHPLSAALVSMQKTLRKTVDGIVAEQPAPITSDPAVVARHIKETAYFLRADAVGICKLLPMPSIPIRQPQANQSSSSMNMP